MRSEDILAKWERLTPEQREAVIKWVNETFGQLAEALQEATAWAARLLEVMAEEEQR